MSELKIETRFTSLKKKKIALLLCFRLTIADFIAGI